MLIPSLNLGLGLRVFEVGVWGLELIRSFNLGLGLRVFEVGV